ncbi:hypothetical protein [Bacillus massilinigeriensis]|uniref:hypothetical protein n=1 Tax=Bacillus massilionigeriensis TaxID=1805475 RepID=UPI00096B5CD2|nr:hypothetical protein [Bacillus massilionigeriensis]
MRIWIVHLLFIPSVLLSGCHRDIPEPEASEGKVSVQNLSDNHVSPVFRINETKPFHVQHQVKQNHVLVECMIPEISFRHNTDKETGKIIVYIDGKREMEVSSAAFIIKGLSSGTHTIKLEVIGTKNQLVQTETISVEIPS